MPAAYPLPPFALSTPFSVPGSCTSYRLERYLATLGVSGGVSSQTTYVTGISAFGTITGPVPPVGTPSIDMACYPPGFSEISPSDRLAAPTDRPSYFYPGVCPQSWETVRSSSVAGPGQMEAFCCPSGFAATKVLFVQSRACVSTIKEAGVFDGPGITAPLTTVSTGVVAALPVIIRYDTSTGFQLSTGAKVGIGIGAAVAVIALLGLGFWILRHRRKKLSLAEKTQHAEPGGGVPELQGAGVSVMRDELDSGPIPEPGVGVPELLGAGTSVMLQELHSEPKSRPGVGVPELAGTDTSVMRGELDSKPISEPCPAETTVEISVRELGYGSGMYNAGKVAEFGGAAAATAAAEAPPEEVLNILATVGNASHRRVSQPPGPWDLGG